MGGAMNEALDAAIWFILIILMATIALIAGVLVYSAAKWVRTMWDEEL